MKKFLVVLAVAVSSVGFGQVIQITKQKHIDALTYSNSDLDIKQFESELLNLINAYRNEHGLSKLDLDSNLHKAALVQSEYMVSINKVTHVNSNSDFSNFSKRIIYFLEGQKKYSVENCCTGNLYLCFIEGLSPAQQIFDLWKNSPGHNANMLNLNINKIGVSLSRSISNDYFYACFDAVSNL